MIVIDAVPDIAAVHDVDALVANTEYVPEAVNVPNDNDEPLPATGLPTVLAPLYNW